MATNHSNKASSVYEEFQSLSNDTWSLDNLLMFCNYQKISIFPALSSTVISILPDFSILDEYSDYLQQEDFIETVELDEKYYYSPQAFAEDYYGTADLDFLVLYFARIDSMFSFNRKKIRVLKRERLSDINRIIVKNKERVKENRSNPTVY